MHTAVSARSSRDSEPAPSARADPPRCAVVAATALAVLAATALAAASVVVLFSCKTVEPPPPPPREEPVRQEVVTWEVMPSEGYHPATGFVTLEFTPPEALETEKEPPPGGRLTVHLGYLNIRDANTVWYRCEVTEGARVRLRLEGEENIPNVRDPDEYWWNDLDIDLEEPVAHEIRVVVTDKRTGATYPFAVRKVITER